LLLERGADPNKSAHGSMAPLQYAALNGSLILIDLLLTYGAGIEERDKRRRTALHYASNVEAARALICRGAVVDVSGDRSETILHSAAECCNANLVRFLIDAGVNPPSPGLRWREANRLGETSGGVHDSRCDRR